MTKPVIVTTEHRGVFYGRLDGNQDETAKTIALTNCRNAMYWSSQTRGFLGLAETGPGEGSKIGATAPRVLLHDVTAVLDCTEEAAEKWENWP